MLASTHCLDCGTELSQERWSGGLCPRCLLVMALEESPSSGPDRLTQAPTLAFPPTTIAPGEIPGNRYRIHSLLGRGGMGEVWRAFDLKLRVDVALKALRKELLEDSHALELLRQEVRAAREVMSPNVCRVFDLEELDGQELVSMEYIDGTTLLEIMKERGPLELEEAREIASQFLAGLEAIHQAELVHRDVKPENIMLTRSGRVVVMDFGVAKRLADSIGSVAGTPAYMAPEQIKGQAIDARADVFSAGVVLAEMIAPEGIGSSEAREKVWRGIHHDPPKLPDSPWLGVLKRAVTPSLEERYASASVLARALEEVTLRIEGAEEVQPYPGLAAFTEEDAEYFFGRELEVEEMWKKLRRPHLLALIGPSGAGKSSFLRAGLIPTMPEEWRVVISTPGNRPFRALAQRLVPEFEGDTEAMTALLDLEEMEVAVPLVAQWRERHMQALVIVDQFEELFTQNPAEVQGRFAELLGRLALEADVHVLLSMRDDFLFQCHPHRALRPILSELTLLGPPEGTALRRAIVQPALKCGYRFEDEELVDEILAEVEEERGALPMLAFAAARLWEKRDREAGLLTREAHQEIGGVSGSLAQHAEATLEHIGSDRIPIVREVFRNLVTAQGTRAARDREELLSAFEHSAGGEVGEGLVPSRAGASPAPTSAGAGGDREAASQVLNTLIDGRLLTSYEVPPAEDEDTGHHRIEIIHESLLTNWPRLVRWQSQDADSALLRDELRQAAQTWNQHDRAADLLWTGTAFREFQLWRECYPGGLTATEEAFAQAMTTHAQRRKRRRRIAVATVIAFLLGVVGIVGMLWRQSEVAKEEAVAEARRAEAAKLLALGRLELEDYPTAAVAYSLASLELADSYEARTFAVEALWRGPTARILTAPGGYYGDWQFIEFSPDGRWLALSSQSDDVLVWSQDGGSPRHLGGHGANFYNVNFSPQGEFLFTSSWADKRLRVWSTEDWTEIRSQEFDSPTFVTIRGEEALTFSKVPDEEARLIRSWPLAGGEPTTLGVWNKEGIGSYEVDPSGTLLAYSSRKGVYARSLAGSDKSREYLLGRHDADVIDLAFDPSGGYLATVDRGGEVRLWSLEDQLLPLLRILEAGSGVGGLGVDLAFDPTGSKLALGTTDEGVRVWDLDGPADAEPILLHGYQSAQFYELGFHPSGRWLAAGAGTAGAILWPLGHTYGKVLQGHSASVTDLAFGPDGTWLASSSFDRTVRLWPMQADDGKEGSGVLFEGLDSISGIAVDPGGERLLVGEMGPPVSLVPLGQGSTRHLTGFTTAINIDGLAFSADGRLAAAGPGFDTQGAVIRVWDLDSGEIRVLDPGADPSSKLGGGDHNVLGLAFLPDGRLVSSGFRGVRLWDLDDGSSTFLYENEDEDCVFMALSENRRSLLFWTGNPGKPPTELFHHDLESGDSRAITAHGERVSAVALDPSGTIAVTGDLDGVIRVGAVTGDEPHLLFGHQRRLWTVAVSPDGRWIGSGDQLGTIRLWPMPDLTKPPLHTLPYDELLAKLHSLTYLRVVEDAESGTGYGVEPGPFPGWEEVPTW